MREEGHLLFECYPAQVCVRDARVVANDASSYTKQQRGPRLPQPRHPLPRQHVPNHKSCR